MYFKTYLKVLESKDIEDANGAVRSETFDAVVDLLNDPFEALRIELHGQGIPRISSLKGQRVKGQRVKGHRSKMK